MQSMADPCEGGTSAGTRRRHALEKGEARRLLVTSRFIGQPVRDYAFQADILLVDGAGIVERIRALEAVKQARLLALAFEGDYQTPTCAACGVKMVERQGKGGSCRNYPKFKVIMARAAQVLDERRI
ncbi:hypothetical protein PPGU19_070140 (plasmid) [Paraburkholderia sp. PGU19]|nr:hypothetical protein PPGU19_070140 [Paraburkholderia sp. PGU19]